MEQKGTVNFQQEDMEQKGTVNLQQGMELKGKATGGYGAKMYS